MKYITLGYFVNDNDEFKKEVFDRAIDSMRAGNAESAYGCYAVSCNDEFGRLEKIEDVIQSQEMGEEEKLEAISEILFS